MKELSILVVTVMNLLITVRYWWLIWKQRIKPALAMWIFFTIAVVGSLVTYLAEGNYSPLDNILNTTDIVLVGSVSIAIAVYGDRSTKFNAFDKGCLTAVLGIVAFWVLTQNHVVTHLSIQAILVIAYFPTVRRLWTSKENTESFALWIAMLVTTAIALLSSQGILATIYLLRAIVSISLLLLLMGWAEWRHRARKIASPPAAARNN